MNVAAGLAPDIRTALNSKWSAMRTAMETSAKCPHEGALCICVFELETVTAAYFEDARTAVNG